MRSPIKFFAAALAFAASLAGAALPPVVEVRGLTSLSGKLNVVALGQARVDPADYRQFTYGYKGGSSDNYDTVAYAVDLLQLEHGWPTTASADVLLAFGLEKIKERNLGEKEFSSWVYLQETISPLIYQIGAASALAARGGIDELRWQAIADGQREYLRAWIGWLSLGGTWGQARDAAPAVKRAPYGAQVLRSTPKDPFIKALLGADYTVIAGKRSWRRDDGAWDGPIQMGPVYLSELGYGEQRRGNALFPIAAVKIVRSRGWPFGLFAPDEQAKLRAASRNDITALRWVVDAVVRDYLPPEPVHILRTARGVSFTMLRAGSAPTATAYHCSWLDDGSVWWAGADVGCRTGEGCIEPGEAHVDTATRKGWVQRTAGEKRPRVDFDLVPGDVVLELLSDRSRSPRIVELQPGSPKAPPPPANDNQPRPEKKGGSGCSAILFLPPSVAAGAFAYWRRRRRAA